MPAGSFVVKCRIYVRSDLSTRISRDATDREDYPPPKSLSTHLIAGLMRAWWKRIRVNSDLKSVETTIKRALEDGVLPYVVIHRASAPRLPEDFKTAKYPGLLCCHT